MAETSLTITLRDAERLAGHLHQLRLLRNRIRDDAPALPEADGAIADALEALDEAESAVNGARGAILSALREADEREAGDRDDLGPLPMPRHP